MENACMKTQQILDFFFIPSHRPGKYVSFSPIFISLLFANCTSGRFYWISMLLLGKESRTRSLFLGMIYPLILCYIFYLSWCCTKHAREVLCNCFPMIYQVSIEKGVKYNLSLDLEPRFWVNSLPCPLISRVHRY